MFCLRISCILISGHFVELQLSLMDLRLNPELPDFKVFNTSTALARDNAHACGTVPVSYTHLTLPTKA